MTPLGFPVDPDVYKMNEKTSVFGSSGFVGSSYVRYNPDQCISIDREDNKPKSNNVLYWLIEFILL